MSFSSKLSSLPALKSYLLFLLYPDVVMYQSIKRNMEINLDKDIIHDLIMETSGLTVDT